MNEGYAIIISAVISVGGIVVVQIINYLYRKEDTVERFYFESFRKRISVYDETISELSRICEDGKVFEKIITNDEYIYRKMFTDIHRLNFLYSRVTLFGSSGAADIIRPLCRTAIELEIKVRKPPFYDSVKDFIVIYRDFIMLVEETVIEFCRYTSGETAAEYIDKKTTNILKKVVKKERAPVKKKKKKFRKNNRNP